MLWHACAWREGLIQLLLLLGWPRVTIAFYQGHEGERRMGVCWRLGQVNPATWLPSCCYT